MKTLSTLDKKISCGKLVKLDCFRILKTQIIPVIIVFQKYSGANVKCIKQSPVAIFGLHKLSFKIIVTIVQINNK